MSSTAKQVLKALGLMVLVLFLLFCAVIFHPDMQMAEQKYASFSSKLNGKEKQVFTTEAGGRIALPCDIHLTFVGAEIHTGRIELRLGQRNETDWYRINPDQTKNKVWGSINLLKQNGIPKIMHVLEADDRKIRYIIADIEPATEKQ